MENLAAIREVSNTNPVKSFAASGGELDPKRFKHPQTIEPQRHLTSHRASPPPADNRRGKSGQIYLPGDSCYTNGIFDGLPRDRFSILLPSIVSIRAVTA
jgi:hypothetical protein